MFSHVNIRDDPILTVSICMGQSINKHRRSNMSAHVLLNLLNKLRERDKMRGLPNILSLFHKFNKFNNTGARMSDSIYHDKIT